MQRPCIDGRPTVLVMADHYLPGFKAGGPIRTLHNLVEALGAEFRFLIVTRDRDLHDRQAFNSVRIDAWNTVGQASVFYASPETLGWHGLRKLLGSTHMDILYLNSFFSPLMTILPLLQRRFQRAPGMPVVLAPRGEFSPGALALKPHRKRAYLALSRALHLFDGVHWQATSDAERAQIMSLIGPAPRRVAIVPNLPSAARLAANAERASGPLRMVFLSRIAPMKNLDFLLQVLTQVRAQVSLTVYGPLGDEAYWKDCLDAARALPANVCFHYAGEVVPEQVPATFAGFDVFVFPTRGENFGHVILESLSAGTPVIVSDRTPWQADHDGALVVLGLDAESDWVRTIHGWASMDTAALADKRGQAAALAEVYVRNNRAADAHRMIFAAALSAPGNRPP